MNSPWQIALKTIIAVSALGCFVPASAQDAAKNYPDKPIRVVVPISAGSATDTTARFVSNALSKAWNVPVVVDNKPGAGVSLGTDMVAKSAADGYTLLFTYAAHYSQTMVQPTSYDPVKDFEPIAQLVDTQLVMAVRADSPFKTVADVISAAKAKPGSVSYGFAGIGTTGHMCGALFEQMAGVKLNGVPYKSASQVPIDTASGQTDLMFGGTASAMPLIRDNRLRVLATTGSMRTAALPGTRLLAEFGLPGYEVSSPVWMMAPRGTPPAIIRKLSDELVRIAGTPEFKEMSLKLAIDPAPLKTEALNANVPREIIKWRRLVDLTQPSGK
jgi:tripartite-type tricarboxylate transporter receptor subunit TctC